MSLFPVVLFYEFGESRVNEVKPGKNNHVFKGGRVPHSLLLARGGGLDCRRF